MAVRGADGNPIDVSRLAPSEPIVSEAKCPRCGQPISACARDAAERALAKLVSAQK